MLRITLLVIGLLLVSPAWAGTPTPGDWTKAEVWAWSRIRADEPADFNAQCGKTLDPQQQTGWDDPCRQIRPKFVVDVLTDPQIEKQIPQHGVRLRGAFIRGPVDLSEIEAKPQLWIDASRIEGELILTDAHLHQMLSLQGTAITGDLSAERLRADSIVFINEHALVRGRTDLAGARTGANLEMENASFVGPVSLNSADLGGALFLSDHASFNNTVDLGNAKIGGILELGSSTFAGTVNLNSADVSGALFMNKSANFKDKVDLGGAKIGANLEMETSSFAGPVTAYSVSVGANLLSYQAVFKGPLSLLGAVVSGNLEMEKSSFASAVDLNRLTVKGSLFMRSGAKFGGLVDLGSADIGSDLEMQGSSFAGPISLNSAHVIGAVFISDRANCKDKVDLGSIRIGDVLDLAGATFAGTVNLNSADITGALFMNDHAAFEGGVDLGGAKVGANIEMETSSFSGPVNAYSLWVGSNLLSYQAVFKGPISLVGAVIGGNLEMEKSSFASTVDLNRLTVKGSLFMRSGAEFGDVVDLGSAQIGGNLEMLGASFARAVNLNTANIGGALLMGGHANFKGEINLVGAKIGSNLEMQSSIFAGTITGYSLSAGANLLSFRAVFEAPVNLVGARIGGILSLVGATASRLDLSEVDGQELLMSGLGWRCAGATSAGGAAKAPPTPVAAHWPLGGLAGQPQKCGGPGAVDPPQLLLRNAHFADFQDSADAWPPLLDLEGFHYDRLGGLSDSPANPMPSRSSRKWEDWLARDPVFSTQPYSQLGAVLAGVGNRDVAEAVEYAGRERERGEVCERDGRLAPRCLWLSLLNATAGYGIERYMWHVLLWVVGLTLLGVVFLWFSPNARRQGPVWMAGASLHRLLPVVSLYKEFDDFFNNAPNDLNPPNLRPWQVFYFACHAIMGWGLGLILLAAMSGLTQKG